MKNYQRYRRRSVVWIAACCFVLACSVRAATAEGLLDYVGAETGFALYLQRAPDWADEPGSLPLVRRLTEFAPVRTWMEGNDYGRLRARLADLEQLLGVPVRTALRDAVGSELLLAVDPQAPGGPAGVLLTSPRSRARMQQILDVFQRVENAEVTKTDDGYFERVGKSGKTVYYLLDDDLFAISDRETRIREIALLRKSGGRHPAALSESAEWRRAAQTLSPQTLISAYFRPPLWKPVVPMTFNTPGFGPVLREMASSESVILGISDREGLHAELNVLPGAEGFSPKIVSLAAEWSSPPKLWADAPRGALLSLVAQGDSGRLARWAESSLPEESGWRAVRTVLRGLLLDRDPIRDVLPQFGSEIGIFVVRTESSDAAPIGGIIAIPYRDAADASIKPGLENLARTGLRLAHSEWNPAESAEDPVHRETVSDGTLYWINEAPLGRPAVFIGADGIWLASNPDLIRRELERPANRPAPRAAADRARLAEMQQVAYLDVRAVRSLLTNRSEELLEFLQVPEDQLPRARDVLSGIREVSKLFDAAYGGVELKPDLMRIRLGLQIDAE